MNSEKLVTDRIESLLTRFAKVHGPLRPPINPAALADLCGVLAVEHKPMVPEGVLTPVPGGFRIYLQSNFVHRHGMKVRERFTLAHELVHTFFYDLADGEPRPTRGAPRGKKLEYLCHAGAGRILVPDALLRQEVSQRGNVASVNDIAQIAKVFNVSIEVMMRRIHTLELFASDKFAAILVNAVDNVTPTIQAACYGPLLLCNAARPKRGMNFEAWLSQLRGRSGRLQESEWTRETPSAVISARKVSRSDRSFFLQLNFDPPRGSYSWPLRNGSPGAGDSQS